MNQTDGRQSITAATDKLGRPVILTQLLLCLTAVLVGTLAPINTLPLATNGGLVILMLTFSTLVLRITGRFAAPERNSCVDRSDRSCRPLGERNSGGAR